MTVRRSTLGGYDQARPCANGATQLHRSRLVLEWTVVEYTAVSSTRQMNTSRCSASFVEMKIITSIVCLVYDEDFQVECGGWIQSLQ